MDGFREMKQAMLVVTSRGDLRPGDSYVALLRLGDYLLEIVYQNIERHATVPIGLAKL